MRIELDSTFLISLPQTAIRVWGIEPKNIKDVKIVELPIRTTQDKSLSQANQIVNKMILSELGDKDHETIARNDLDAAHAYSSVLDCNILNLAHHYPNLGRPAEVKILDYSSLGHRSLVKSDAMNPREATRATLRNYRFRKKFSPTLIVHWDDYALARRKSLINFGWSNGFVDTSLVIEKSKTFMRNNLSKIPEIVNIPLESQIVIIAPHINCTEAELIAELHNLVSTNLGARTALDNCDFILIKQHRTSILNFRNQFKIFGKTCLVLQSAVSRAIPIEIYMHGFDKSTIFSAPSSAVYSHESNTLLLHSRITRVDFKEYGLMSHRHKRIVTQP